jgi:hypothetical protein
MEFREFANSAEGNNDTNYCTVASCAVVFGLSYADAYAIFKAHGRKDGHGVPWDKLGEIVREIAKEKGFKVTEFQRCHFNKSYRFMEFFPEQDKMWSFFGGEDRKTLLKMRTWDGLTTKNFREYLGKGDYILGVRKHVAGVKNGILKDWTAYQTRKGKPGESSARIYHIYKIEKIGEKKKTLTDLLNELKS